MASLWVRDFHAEKSLAERESESAQIRKTHDDRVPVIVDRASVDTPEINRHKFLCPKDLNVGQFAFVIRKRVGIKPEEALFIFCGGEDEERTLPPTSATMHVTYDERKSPDGFLYITYSLENTFG